MKILMVCLGNICRSPLAEGILKHKLGQKNLNATVESAGTGGYHIGALPDIRSIEIANKYSIDLTDQRARKVRSIDLEEFDLIFAMDTYNFQDLRKMAREEELSKIKLILNESHPNKNLSVPDPYYGGNDGFENVYHLLDQACERIIENYGIK
ncbi:MAG: low molecular weight protein-tyrosine-phosphatase [Chitinophagales bacterium]|jgi:protein-tyrosine phosphatase|nr:low molecular weight phosphotyrosine protein phosphatase [Sphingobacteriales bacterium]